MPLGRDFDGRLVKPSLVQADLLQTSDLEALATLDDLHEVSRRGETVMASGVEPRGSAAKHFNRQFVLIKISLIEIGYFKFAAG